MWEAAEETARGAASLETKRSSVVFCFRTVEHAIPISDGGGGDPRHDEQMKKQAVSDTSSSPGSPSKDNGV